MNAKTAKLLSRVFARVAPDLPPEMRRSFKKEMKREWQSMNQRERALKRKVYEKALGMTPPSPE